MLENKLKFKIGFHCCASCRDWKSGKNISSAFFGP